MGTEMASGRITGYFGPIVHLENIFASIYQRPAREWCVLFPKGWEEIAREGDGYMDMVELFATKGMWSRAVQHLGYAQTLYNECEDAFWADIRSDWRIFDVAMKIGKDV